jgi:hypothetical protein
MEIVNYKCDLCGKMCGKPVGFNVDFGDRKSIVNILVWDEAGEKDFDVCNLCLESILYRIQRTLINNRTKKSEEPN